MKGFSLNEQGDVLLEKHDIKMVEDTDFLVQKIRQVLSTNRGEWWLDKKEGVPVGKILKKNPSSAMIRDYVRSAVAQVDNTLELTRCDIATKGRTLSVSFEVSGKSGTVRSELEV